MDIPLYPAIAPKPPGLPGTEGKVLLPDRSTAPALLSDHHPRREARRKRPRVDLPAPSEEKSKEVQPIIDRLYDGEGLQLRVVTDIMWRLYHFRAPDNWYNRGRTGFGSRGIKKNRTRPGRSQRTRPRCIPKPPPAAIPQAVVQEGDFTFKPNLERLTQYPHQERLLSSLDCYIYKLFDTGGDGWTADLLTFTKRQGSRENTIALWQELADQTYGASVLIRSGNREQAETTLANFLDRLRGVARHDDPSIFVKFWRICLGLDGLDKCSGGIFNAKARLLRRLQEIFAEKDGGRHLLAPMVTSLSEVPSADFRDTLRIGFDKTLRTITALVGDENAIILHMWSHFFKYWNKRFLATRVLFWKFQEVWMKVHDRNRVEHAEEAISVHYYYAYAAYYLWEPKHLGETMVTQLFDRTERFFCMVDRPRWSLIALAFAFSARITALVHRSAGRNYLCRHVMNLAIEKLECGDRECMTRAAMLSGILAKWLKHWGHVEESRTESLRAAGIRSELEDKYQTVEA